VLRGVPAVDVLGSFNGEEEIARTLCVAMAPSTPRVFFSLFSFFFLPLPEKAMQVRHPAGEGVVLVRDGVKRLVSSKFHLGERGRKEEN
jgi:hypothetical protein